MLYFVCCSSEFYLLILSFMNSFRLVDEDGMSILKELLQNKFLGTTFCNTTHFHFVFSYFNPGKTDSVISRVNFSF